MMLISSNVLYGRGHVCPCMCLQFACPSDRVPPTDGSCTHESQASLPPALHRGQDARRREVKPRGRRPEMAPIKLRTNTMTSSCWRPPGPRTHTACDLLSSPRPSQTASQGSHHRPAAALAHPRHSFMPVIVARRPGHHHHAGGAAGSCPRQLTLRLWLRENGSQSMHSTRLPCCLART